MLIGQILRSPHAHARIRSIDSSAAEALPGVKAVVIRDDFADRNDEFRDVLVNIMAADKRFTTDMRSPRSPPPAPSLRARLSRSSRLTTRCCRMSPMSRRRCGRMLR
jgi:CO/xanthine dehydrogenase Mo-binding subunit